MPVSIYKKWSQNSFTESLQFSEELSKLMENVMKCGNPANQIENMMKYGFNLGSKSIMGTQDIMRQLRRKKLEEMRKNISGTYERETSVTTKVKDKEMEEIISKMKQTIRNQGDKTSQEAQELYERSLSDMQQRSEILSKIPSGFKKDLNTLKKYRDEKDFLSQDAKQMFENLMNQIQNIERLSEFLKKHPYGFNEGNPLGMKEAMELVERFEKIEDIENKLKDGAIQDINPETIREILGEDIETDFSTLQKILEILKESGYFVVQGNAIQMTPRAVRKIGYKILQDIFSDIKSKVAGMHRTKRSGNYELDYEDKKKWEFGENTNIDIFSTLKNAIISGRYNTVTGEVNVDREDFEIYKSRHFGRTSTALLIDTSWSMSWGNKFDCAKRVAIALHSLTSSFFPNDTLYIIAFFTVAMEIKPHELLSVELNMNDPFTNMQDAIRLARKLLKKSSAEDKQIIIVTDGQPTAYCIGNRVFVEWPVMGCSPNAMRETLKEVHEATKENIRINVFMIEENPQVEKFVEEVVRINKGRAFFTTPETLGKFLILDFVSRKRSYVRT
ncbi:MAG: VWA domain-containing protein [Candidatus Calescibacterium sp.]|nr:VWA domain-containing protein [Candidatus Calescibacterium sp.]